MPREQGNAKAPRTMSDEHRAALAAGRDDGRIVKAYLEAVEAAGPRKPGRRRTPEDIQAKLTSIEEQLKQASALARLHLIQERRDLVAELASLQRGSPRDLDSLRESFLKVAKRYSQRKGISFGAWREVGVDAETLNQAGISR